MTASLAIVLLCLGIGGVLKGATGAGAPILAVPALAMIFDVQFAVAVMLIPNLVTNVWQAWRFREHLRNYAFVASFASAGALGVLLGTVMLARFPQEVLSILVALSVLGYVVFRFTRTDWALPASAASRLSFPFGCLAGMLQGASGISAPVSLSFLNAIRLERSVFIATVSMFFTAMTAAQIPLAAHFGILTPERLAISTVAIVPILAFMPVGALLARRVSRESFDRIILALLTALALKLMFDAAT